MKILVLSSGGMLGHKMLERLQAHYSDVIGLSRKDFDAANPMAAHAILCQHLPSVVVNCAGLIKQRTVDSNQMMAVNGLFPHSLQRECYAQGAYLVHFSTDCVFSGKTGHYSEDSPSDPEDIYGVSKRIGEITTAQNALTIRTSIIGRERENFRGLLEWFLRQKGEVQGHDKAIFTGVTTNWLADVVAEIIRQDRLLGLYQVASPPITKFDLLRMFQEAYDKKDVTIVPVDEPRCDRSLRGGKFERATGIITPDLWRQVVGQRWQDKGSGYAI
jgi:dTDP-4-dehydrorhamnose reductase